MADQIVVWSPEALEDIDAIAAYIARDSVFYAAAVVEKMLGGGRRLESFPTGWTCCAGVEPARPT